MYLKSIEITGFKSFGKKTELRFGSAIAAIVGPNGSGKSNVAEAFRFVLGEQSMRSLRSKKGEDLIWGGSQSLARLNRAAVSVTFDNSSRLLDTDFDEVVLERVVYRDGQNEYMLNGTQVRLKDILRLLAGANIGGSGYQIISQGEADRILNAHPIERREMMEDALGLKLYQHKKIESERKLAETANNIEKTRSLRRELAPHLKFLRSQAERVEKAREMRDDLASRIQEYLEHENSWIRDERVRILHEISVCQNSLKISELNEQKANSLATSFKSDRFDILNANLRAQELSLADTRRRKGETERELGRAEGRAQAKTTNTQDTVPVCKVREFADNTSSSLVQIESTDDVVAIHGIAYDLRISTQSFVSSVSGIDAVRDTEAEMVVEKCSATLRHLDEEESGIQIEIGKLRASMQAIREESYTAERDLASAISTSRQFRADLERKQSELAGINTYKARYEEDVREAILLLGSKMPRISNDFFLHIAEDRSIQERRRKDIERLKIKLEDVGLDNGEEIIKEYTSTRERDEFLAKELADLDDSSKSLSGIIAELESTIDKKFADGLKKINSALQGFFVQLFGGGSCVLELQKPKLSRANSEDTDAEVVDDIADLRVGLSILVSLPRKKINGLESMSGGERALTSIAMIFAMTQVNPPPFLILDETDAALDEANSKRYADMIRQLGEHSQLIVITHNRSTMASAGELFGVTMTHDGVSKLLSVKLEEAERAAK